MANINEGSRAVIISEIAVKRAEIYQKDTMKRSGVRLSLGAIFAQALDTMLEAEGI